MASLIGAPKEFAIGGTESFEAYEERMSIFFTANGVEDAAKQKALFLTLCGADLYQLLRSLTSPSKPNDKTYADLVKLVNEHLNPKPNVIVERFRFNSRVRKPGEGIAQFVADLRHLSRFCEYNDTDEMIRDRLVCGINEVGIQRKLLAEVKLDLKRATAIATGMEMAAREASAMSGAHKIHVVDHGKSKKEACYRCGDSRHKSADCLYKDNECFFCKKRGHISRMCGARKKATGKPINRVGDQVDSSSSTGLAGLEQDLRNFRFPEDLETGDVFHVYRTTICKEAPIFIEVQVNHENVKMELDTGASISVAGRMELEKVIGQVLTLEETPIKLQTYGGKIIQPAGVVNVEVGYKGQNMKLPIVVTSESGPILMGRNWLRKLDLDWRGVMAEIFPVSDVHEVKSRLDGLLDKYSDVFKDELGTMKGVNVHLEQKPDCKPKFFRARSVPYALKKGIEDELDRLIKQGTYKAVSHSAWAAPIVPVRKDDGSIRICGDYKLTVNPATECDTYPVPKTEDLLATLNGGDMFSKLDLRQAYQQILLDEESQRLCTINTHRGLFQPTRLQYGIHAASGLFQREMECRLTDVPRTIVRVDDILITGKGDNEHFANLEKVLQMLQENGLRLKRSKCTFLSPEVTYLGFKISSKGVETVEEKVQAVLEAPAPNNISKLRSFLGMLQYYHRHLPNLASTLEPLHKLLRNNEPWVWGEPQEAAFQAAKGRLASSDLLVHYDPAKPLVLAVDASPYGVGAVLSHRLDQTERPIAYASRTLNFAERNYSQTEREGLAMIYGVKKFHQYLYGQKFQVLTDHKPLLGIFGESRPIPVHSAARVQRWAIIMSAYNYELLYRPGEKNGNADGMSRLPVQCMDEEEFRVPNHIHMVDLVHAPVTSAEVKRETGKDVVLTRVKEFVVEGWPDEFVPGEDFKPYKSRAEELTVEDGCILWGGRVVIPPKFREKILQELHSSHAGMNRMKMLARGYCWWPGMDQQIEGEASCCDVCIEFARNPPAAILHPWEMPSRPWSRIHLDHAGPFLGRTFLIVVDSYTKWVDIYDVPSTATEHVIEKLRTSFKMQGLPDSIISDNYHSFTSKEFEDFVKSNGVLHITSAPYHPSSNGAAERTVQSFKQTLKKLNATSRASLSTQM